MNIESLKTFCLVVEEKSISRAAQISYVSQPSVTRQIKALEDFYGLQLFDRKGNKLTVTEAGRVIYPIIKSVVTDFQGSLEIVKRMKGEHQFTLRIGSSLGVGEYILPTLLGRFKKNHPEALLSLKIGDTKTVLEGINQDLFHIGIVEGEFDHSECHTEVLAEDELILITGPDHPWRTRRMIEIPEVINEQLIRRIEKSEFRLRVEEELRKFNILDKISTYIELETTQAIKNAVEAGLGISFISRIAAEKELEAGRLIEVDIKDFKIIRPLYIVMKKSRLLHKGTEKFIDMLIDMPEYKLRNQPGK